MSTATWVARIALALVLAVAGGAKLGDQAGARRTVAGFGVPARFVGAGAVVVSVVELLVGVGLLLRGGTARAAAVGALVLLMIFLVGLGVQLARGIKVPCACFGNLRATPAGWPTLVRNGVLAGGALFLVVRLR